MPYSKPYSCANQSLFACSSWRGTHLVLLAKDRAQRALALDACLPKLVGAFEAAKKVVLQVRLCERDVGFARLVCALGLAFSGRSSCANRGNGIEKVVGGRKRGKRADLRWMALDL